MMEAVVSEGTGVSAAIPGVTVAGKTGRRRSGRTGRDAWFIAFAPARIRRCAVAVLIVNGGVGGDGGGADCPRGDGGGARTMTDPAAVVLDMEGVLHVDWQALPARRKRFATCTQRESRRPS